jgi:hypothetical protein
MNRAFAQPEEEVVMNPSRPPRRTGVALAAALALAALLPGTSAQAQEVALVHEAGDRIRVAGMPLRQYAAGLRMEMREGEEAGYPDVCFVALVDSEGNVWEEYVSEPFRSREGELDNACVPRFPILPSGSFPEVAMMVPLQAGFGSDGSEVFFGGSVDWAFLVDLLSRDSDGLAALFPKVEDAYLKIDDIAGESVQPPPHMEGVEYDWVALFFMVGPSEERESRYQPGQPQYSTAPIMILVGAN